MQIKLAQLEQRIAELEVLAEQLAAMAKQLDEGKAVQPHFSQLGQRWYRGCRELLTQSGLSGLSGFDACYEYPIHKTGLNQYFRSGLNSRMTVIRDSWCPTYDDFLSNFWEARSIFKAAIEEIKSRELPIVSQLSFAVSAREFDTAQQLFDSSNSDEALIRAAGVVGRVALERHLFTVADTHNISIQVNPPSKKKAEASDVLTTLVKAGILTAVQRSELESLFTVANYCAHPKETVKPEDVQRLINRGKELAAVIM